MVNTFAAILLVAALAAPGEAKTQAKVKVSMLAVQATYESRAERPRVARKTPAPTPSETAAPPTTQTPVSPLHQSYAPGIKVKPQPPVEQGADTRFFEAGLESIRQYEYVNSLPYDTFHKVRSDSSAVELKEAANFVINDQYTLHLTPLNADPEGRIRVQVSIDEKSTQNGQTRTRRALDTTSAIAPGKHLLLGGLPLAQGQLIVFVGVAP